MKKLHRAEAESYWWFRFIKAAYICFLILVAVGTWEIISWPKVSLYESGYGMKCLNTDLTFGDMKGTDIEYDNAKAYNKQEFSFSDPIKDVLSKIICEKKAVPDKQTLGTLLDDVSKYGDTFYAYTFKDKNYKIIVQDKVYDPTYKEFGQTILWIIFGAWILLGVVPKVFDYILFGKHEELEY